MDYNDQTLSFKLRKACRYIRLYGPRLTWAKVKAQQHARRHYVELPKTPQPTREDSHVGFIGCGNYAYSMMAHFLRKNFGAVLRGAMDLDIHKAASLAQSYGFDYYTDNVDKLLDDPKIDVVFIASNHASHAEYAIKALQAGKSVHIEKPHVVNEEQLERLLEAMESSAGRVALGFNRPISKIGKIIKSHLDSQPGAAMMNWFVAGHEIPLDHWYFQESEGGRILGNLCHWTDFIYQMMPAETRFPIKIIPARSVKSDCDVAVSYVFGDGSIAAITFSAKGHTFEGVRESFSAHRGNILLAMKDFQELTVEEVARKRTYRLLFRDHGHEVNLCRSYSMSGRGPDKKFVGCSASYIWQTGQLFLKTRQALELNQPIELDSYEHYLQQKNDRVVTMSV